MSADLSSGGGPPGEVPLPAPRVVPSFGDWLRVNLAIGTLSFGSASRIVLYEDAVVRDRGWLTADEFSEVLTVAQLLPGPNLVNLSAYLGYRLVGVAGALVGIVCLCLPGAVLAVALSSVLAVDSPWVQAPLRGMAVAGIVLLLLFLWRRLPGLASTADPEKPASTRLRVARGFLLAAVGSAVLLGASLFVILAVAIPVGLVLEFAL
ncbi:MAG TPA: chromate transporter [Myxococcaceae bacterium]|nr:chromate transporter [Myxococcaceae bacterium]